MKNLPMEKTMYKAFIKRDAEFEGIFYVGVKTTGTFCRPTCPARKPLRKNIEFFQSTNEAILAGFKPCKRCNPMDPPGKIPLWIEKLLEKIKSDGSIKWKDSELRNHGFDPARVRRWFKKNHKMTFHSFIRSIKLGQALVGLKEGKNLTQTAFEHGYESLSGFRDALKKITGISPGRSGNLNTVYLNRIITPLGPMIAGATNKGICLLEFIDRRMLATQIKILRKRLNCNFAQGSNKFIDSLDFEIKEYFKGNRKKFETPIIFPGTEFQEKVWNTLLAIPDGQTISYEELAYRIGNPAAVRAVAKANGHNRIAILIPCHRVIGKDGNLTGYGGGLWRKRYLLNLENSKFIR